jgi:hypothetical protein
MGHDDDAATSVGAASDAGTSMTDTRAIDWPAARPSLSFDHGQAHPVGPTVEPGLPELCALGHVCSPTDLGRSPLHRQLGEDLDLRLRHHDGSHSPVGICIAPVETTDDPYFVTTIVDITMRMAIADVLADGERRYRTVLELRPAYAKLDISIVRDIDCDTVRQAMVAGLEYFAVSTGCQLIAEGVETKAEAVILGALGVTLAQGYLFARPGLLGSAA